MTYHELQEDAISFGEGVKDCAVKAVALAANVKYSVAHAYLKLWGRFDGCPTPFWVTQRALKALGFRCVPVKVASKTVRTLERELSSGVYLVRVRGHILCCRDGQVGCWTRGRLNRVREVYQVVPND